MSNKKLMLQIIFNVESETGITALPESTRQRIYENIEKTITDLRDNMTRKTNLIVSIICFSWIFIFIGLTAILDDYFMLGWWWHLMMLPTWIWLIHSYYKTYVDWKRGKLKQKG